jgi:hypothetical protein
MAVVNSFAVMRNAEPAICMITREGLVLYILDQVTWLFGRAHTFAPRPAYDIASPEFFATDSLTLSRSRINSCQSAPPAAASPLIARGNIGADKVMVTSEGRGKHAPSGKNSRVPLSDTGIIGAPVSTAALNAPN